MDPFIDYYQAETDYRREQLRDVRRAQAARKAARLRAFLRTRHADQEARDSLVRVA